MVLVCLKNCFRQLQTAENFGFSFKLAENQDALSFKDPLCLMNWEESGAQGPWLLQHCCFCFGHLFSDVCLHVYSQYLVYCLNDVFI